MEADIARQIMLNAQAIKTDRWWEQIKDRVLTAIANEAKEGYGHDRLTIGIRHELNSPNWIAHKPFAEKLIMELKKLKYTVVEDVDDYTIYIKW